MRCRVCQVFLPGYVLSLTLSAMVRQMLWRSLLALSEPAHIRVRGIQGIVQVQLFSESFTISTSSLDTLGIDALWIPHLIKSGLRLTKAIRIGMFLLNFVLLSTEVVKLACGFWGAVFAVVMV